MYVCPLLRAILESDLLHGTGYSLFLYILVVKFDLALPNDFVNDCVQVALANGLREIV